MKEKSTSNPPTKKSFIKSPQSMNMFSATARSIMDELRDKHKAIEQHGIKKIHPSELVTLDRVSTFLSKYSNLSEQAKSTESIDQALKVLTDQESNGKERYLYLYPFLLKSGNKVSSKIALISPQNAHEVDVIPYRQACFDYSKPMIDLILTNRAKKSKEINEDQPGNSLILKNKQGENWLNPERFSLESEISSLLKSGFKPYKFIPIRDFIEDFLEYGNGKKSIEEITPNYHIIIDEIQLNEDGSYKVQPEVVIHYRAQADGLEKFAMEYLPKLADSGSSESKQLIHDYRFNHMDAALPGRKQNRDKVKALISMIKAFPFSQTNSDLSKSVQETCDKSIRILNTLIINMDKIIERKYASIEKKLVLNINQMISDHTKSKMTLLTLDLKKEIEGSGIKDTQKINELIEFLEKEISKTFGIRSIENSKSKFYTIDQSYMASVLHKYGTTSKDDPEMQKEYEIAMKINEEMISSKNPRLNINLNEEHVEKMNQDLNRMAIESKAKEKSDFFQNKFNSTVFLITLILGITVTTFLFSLGEDFEYILFGLPLTLFISFMAATIIKKKEPSMNDEPSKDTKTKMPSIDMREESKEEKMNQIAKAASKHVFPANYHHISEKVYSSQSLKDKIQDHIEEIKLSVPVLKKEADMQKVASTIEHSILNTSITIAIPGDVTVPNKPSSIIISRNDFKAPLYRRQLADFYREEMEKKKTDKALVGYYKFLINTLEIEYPKYLNKKIR
ncbi:MAG: hypothetical protein H7A24_08905 [Leptospiraceae bacterium]|nr:hypothetical protein [Leptospiraceae bacterium]MCP5511987.1 hypothetical protein [Leptospiraceae bacterium]